MQIALAHSLIPGAECVAFLHRGCYPRRREGGTTASQERLPFFWVALSVPVSVFLQPAQATRPADKATLRRSHTNRVRLRMTNLLWLFPLDGDAETRVLGTQG
jgi:hypothetical protein